MLFDIRVGLFKCGVVCIIRILIPIELNGLWCKQAR